MLQAWISSRDPVEVTGSQFISPLIVHQFVAAASVGGEEVAEICLKAGQVLLRKFKQSGLLGFPIYIAPAVAEAHWTLLVLRKIGSRVDIRYYDSLTEEVVINRTVADDICSFMRKSLPEFQFPEVLPVRENKRSRQSNGVDCGVFAMYFWEGELRRWIGEGWSLPFPQTSQKGPIYKFRCRLV